LLLREEDSFAEQGGHEAGMGGGVRRLRRRAVGDRLGGHVERERGPHPVDGHPPSESLRQRQQAADQLLRSLFHALVRGVVLEDREDGVGRRQRHGVRAWQGCVLERLRRRQRLCERDHADGEASAQCTTEHGDVRHHA
jgi:hypothetical protein